MIRNTESRSCYDFDNNQTVKSLPNVTEQCRCPFPFAPDVCSEREVNNIQLDAEDDSEDEGGAVKYSQEEATISDLTKETDSAEFKDFMKTVPMTGDLEIDQEIVSFYRNKFCS